MCSYSNSMGTKTDLIIAAERGESEKLQRLLDTGSYDANEGDMHIKFVERVEGKERGKEKEKAERGKNCVMLT